MKMKKRIKALALCLCMVMLFTCLPGNALTALAEDNAAAGVSTVQESETAIQSEDPAAVQEAVPTEQADQVPSTDAGSVPDASVPEPTPEADGTAPVFADEMEFSVLQTYAKANDVRAEEKIAVKIDDDGNLTDENINAGAINETTAPVWEGKQFEGAFVVKTAEDGTVTEDEIKYAGTYTSEDGTQHTYYAFSETPDTGILLKDGQYIKLVYRSICSITYQVELQDGTVLGNGMLAEDGSAVQGSGGGFVSAVQKLDKGETLNLQFKEEKSAGQGGSDYVLTGLYQENADGSRTAIDVDKDKVAKIENLSADTRIVAVVRRVDTYKLTETHSRGHICWAGNSDENNSNVADPYSVDPSLFCSYDADGSVTGTKGATVTAAPGGTIYFVMYSQAGSKWQLQHLIINGTYIDTTCDGEVHDTDLGNGMTAHFQYLGDEKKDKHLTDTREWYEKLETAPADKERSKFACWITNVNSDIAADFECESEKRETLTLVQADGIEKIVASSFDLYDKADYYKGIYDGGDDVIFHLRTLKFPNRTLTSEDIGKDLVNEYWSSSSKSGALSSDDNHSSVEYKHSSSGYGNRYVYFKVKDGYDPNTVVAKITGQDTPLLVDSIANAKSKPTSHFFGLFKSDRNQALTKARKSGYEWFTYYEGVGQYFRQLSLSADPYTYAVEYQLDGGTINGSDVWTDANKYTVESGNNTILLPAATPVKEGYVFQGWELEPVNEKYADSTKPIYDENSKFVVDSTTYEYGLVTEKTTYELDGTTYTDWNAVSGAEHKFVFKAIWVEENDPSSVKANYTISSYKEVSQDVYNTLLETQRTMNEGKYYQLMTGYPQAYVGTVGETIIGIPADPESGYVLSDSSITRLENFKADGNTDTALIYYYDVIHSLTVTKELKGDYADKTKAFDVTISLKNAAGEAVSGEFACTYADGSTGTITFTNGSAVVALKGGESVSITGLASGSYSVLEAADDNYDVTYSVDGGAAETTAPADKALNLTISEGTITNAASAVTITNTRKNVVPTAVDAGRSTRQTLPYLGVLFVGMLLFAASMKVVFRGKRRR